MAGNGSTAAVATRRKLTEHAVEVPPLNLRRIELTLIGDSSLITNRWSNKSKQMLLDRQMKKAIKGREAKDPDEQFRESIYHTPDGKYGFPSAAFKAAAVDATRFIPDFTMTKTRGAFHVEGELVVVEGEPQKREDMVRLQMGVADIRYRAEFPIWRVTLPIIFNAAAISEGQIVNLFNIAGFGVGIGEWRPDKGGPHGRFHVATEGE